jgi:hypothetical protein
MPDSRKYAGSDAAQAASDYFNLLPQDERAKLAPLLEHYRQMGLAEAREQVQRTVTVLNARINTIAQAGDPAPAGETP